MNESLMLIPVIFLIATLMTLTGRGGGNFYVLSLALSGLDMHRAATTGQFILIVSSLAASFLFAKQKNTDWKLVLYIGIITFISAFAGGFFSSSFDSKSLKLVFSFFIALASILMLRPKKEAEHKIKDKKRWFNFELESADKIYTVNPFIILPILAVTGFVSGMVGISGGSFLVPLMILALNVPMHTAVGTSTALVTVTASAGFFGHLHSGHFDIFYALPLAISGLVGGAVGAKLSEKFKPGKLKLLFAFTSITAAIIMLCKK